MTLVLVDPTWTPSPREVEDDHDKDAEKKDKGELGAPLTKSTCNEELVIVPSLDSVPPKNSVENVTEMGKSASSPTSTSRKRNLSLKGAQEGDDRERTKVVKVAKIVKLKEKKRSKKRQSCKSKSVPKNEKRHICKDCGQVFSCMRSFLIHNRREHSASEGKFECKICKTKFVFSCDFRRHSGTHTGDIDKLIKCPDCGVGFSTARALANHDRRAHNSKNSNHDHISILQGDHPDDPVRYRCKNCGLQFYSKHTIRAHRSCKKKRLLTRFPCEKCGKAYSSRNSLRRHMTMTIHGEKGFLCEVCKMPFGRIDSVKRHANCHTGDNLIKCPECEAGFNNRVALISHLRFHKEKDGCQSFKCRKCGEESRNETYFCRHLFSHTAENESSFTSNPKNGGSESAVDAPSPATPTPTKPKDIPEVVVMYDHISIIQDNPVRYQCNYCQVKFRGRSRIINHKLCPTGEVSLPNYNCKACGMVFSRKCELTSHLRTHSEKKTFVCDVCNAEFSSSRNLRLHGKCHSTIPGGRLLKCHICGLKFNSKRLLTSHVFRHEAEVKSSPARFQCQICAIFFAKRHDRDQHIKLRHQPKVLLRRLDATDMDYPVLPDTDSTTLIDQWEDAAIPFLYLDRSKSPSPPPPQQNSKWYWDDNKADDVSPPTFTSALEAAECHSKEISEWPQWNIFLPGSNPVGKGDCVAPKLNLQLQQMIPSVKKLEPERLEHATVFVVALPMPIIYIPTNEVFLIDQNFECKSILTPDLILNNAVKMETMAYGYGLETKGVVSCFTSQTSLL